MGFNSLTEADYISPATALGGLTNGVTVEENTNAFGTFANNGQFIDAYIIDKITDKEGNIVYQHEVKPVDVFSPQTAYLTYDMMRDVITSGTATSLKSRLKFRSDWAGKTGTSQNYKDVWFVATNPNVSFGTWMGYDNPKPVQTSYKGMSYSTRNITLWARLMNAAHDIAPDLVDPSEPLKRPEGIVTRSFCGLTGLAPTQACANAGLVRTDLFNEKFVPKKGDSHLKMESRRFVTVGNMKYLALNSTPSEFVETGYTLDAQSIQKYLGISTDPSKLAINNKSVGRVSSSAVMKENGRVPHALSVSGSGNGVSWGNHSDSDIIGYRVYKNGAKVATIKAGTSRSYQGGNGSYYVTAVDIAGKESGPSNVVMVGQATTPPAVETPKETPEDTQPVTPAPEPTPTEPKKPEQTQPEKETPSEGQPQTQAQNQNKTDKQPAPTVPNQNQ